MNSSALEPIETKFAPKPVGPYNQAILIENWLYCSGQIALDPATGKMVGNGNIEEETKQLLKRRVCKSIRRIVTVAESSREDISRDHKVDIDRIHVVPIGIDTDFFSPQPSIDRIPGRIVSTASADVPLKGQRYLLEALAKVREKYPNVHLELVGKQREGSTTAETLEQLGLSAIVNFNQGISYRELVDLLASASVAVVPSLYEGFSIPAIEALSCGAPLIATT